MTLDDYFQSYEDYFWQWEDKGEVIAIPEGATIAYRNQVESLVYILSQQRLPRFGSLLLAWIATNPQAKENLKHIEETLTDFIHQEISDRTNKNLIENYETAIHFLTTLSEIPETYKQGEKRVLVFQAIFQDCHNCLSQKQSTAIFQGLSEEKIENYYQGKKLPFHNKVCFRDLKTLAHLSQQFPTPAAILEQVGFLEKQEVDNIVFEEKKLIEQAKPATDLMQELLENPNTFQVGALVKQIWGSVHLPLHYHLPNQQPFGGVSDITNRGNFDKLLLSEFAHDDLIFISRLANNEALFFNREVPPSDTPYERYLLIDVSLKNWGNIKTILFAIATALRHHPKNTITHKVFALGDAPQEVFLEDIHGIIESLQVLGTSTHIAPTLEVFFQEAFEKDKDVVLLTSESNYEHPAVQKILQQPQHHIDYLIQADQAGNIQTFKYKNKKRTFLQDSKLPLEVLWRRPEKPKEVVTLEDNKLQFPNFPILLPIPQVYRQLCIASDGVCFLFTKEKSLLKRNKENEHGKGLELLVQHLPFNPTSAAIGLNQNQEYVLLMYSINQKELFLLNLFTKKNKVIPFPEWASRQAHFIFYHHQFYYIKDDQHWIINMEGKITKKQTESDFLHFEQEKYIEKKSVQESSFKTVSRQPILKNIHKIYINENHNLVFNIHELRVVPRKTPFVGFAVKRNDSTLHQTTTTTNSFVHNIFYFKEGSKIITNPLGVVKLISSNPDIPPFFILILVDGMLRAASEHEFSGNDYYARFKENPVKQAKYANYMGTIQNTISSMDFYNKYILAFINHIEANATPD